MVDRALSGDRQALQVNVRSHHYLTCAVSGGPTRGGSAHLPAFLCSRGDANRSLVKLKSPCEVARILPHARKWLQIEPARKELQDRRRVVGRMIHMPMSSKRGNNNRGDPCAWSPSVGPPRS